MRFDNIGNEERGEVYIWSLMFKIAGILIVASIVLGGAAWGMGMFSRPFRTVSEITEQTFNGNNVIYNYEYFFNQYGVITATKAKVEIAKEEETKFKEVHPDPSKWDYTTQKEYEALSENYRGVKNILQDQVAEYNANASKANKNIFKSAECPDHVSVD